jgi:invasion protein IalB
VKAEPSQADWTKVCGKDPAGTEICYTTRDFVSDQGQPVLAVAIYDIKAAQPQKIVRFLMPLGLLLQPGIRFAVDQGQPTPGRYAVCFPNGCFAEAQVKDDLVNAFKKGTTLNVSVQNQAGREVTFAVPAAGFGKAFDGPPIDPKVLEEQQKKLQEELEKRSDELRKRLEQQSGAAGGTAPAAPAAPAAAAATAPRPGAAPATPPRP